MNFPFHFLNSLKGLVVFPTASASRNKHGFLDVAVAYTVGWKEASRLGSQVSTSET